MRARVYGGAFKASLLRGAITAGPWQGVRTTLCVGRGPTPADSVNS